MYCNIKHVVNVLFWKAPEMCFWSMVLFGNIVIIFLAHVNTCDRSLWKPTERVYKKQINKSAMFYS